MELLRRIGSGADVDDAINGSGVLPPLRGGASSICRQPSHWLALEAIIGGERDGAPDCRYRVKLWTDRISVTGFEESLSLLPGKSSAGTGKERRLFWTELDVAAETDMLPRSEQHPTAGTITVHQHVRGQGTTEHWLVQTGEIKTTFAAGMSRSRLHQLSPFDFSDEFRSAVERTRQALASIFVLDPVPSAMRQVVTLSDRLKPDASNLAGVLATLDPQTKASIEQTLTEQLHRFPEPDIRRVWSGRLGVLESEARLYCQEGWSGSEPTTIDARTYSVTVMPPSCPQ